MLIVLFNNLKESTMKKLIDTLSGIKNKFCQQNSAVDKSALCVEFTDAAERTSGGRGKYAEWGGTRFRG